MNNIGNESNVCCETKLFEVANERNILYSQKTIEEDVYWEILKEEGKLSVRSLSEEIARI